MDQKYEMIMNSYDSLKLILSPNLTDDKIYFMNVILELIKTQIKFYREILTSNDPKKFFEMLNSNNQNLSKEIKKLYDNYTNITASSTRNFINQKNEEITISNGNNEDNDKENENETIKNNINQIKVKIQPKLNLNEEKKLNIISANSIHANPRYDSLIEKTEENKVEKNSIKIKEKNYFKTENKNDKYVSDIIKKENDNNNKTLTTTSKNKIEKKNLFNKNEIQKHPIKINLFDKNSSNKYHNENGSGFLNQYYTCDCVGSLNEKINNESEVSRQILTNSSGNNIMVNSAEFPHKNENNIFSREFSENSFSNSILQSKKNENSIDLIISIKHTNRLNNYLKNRKNKNFLKNEIIIKEVNDDINNNNNKNNIPNDKHIIKNTNNISHKKINKSLIKSNTQNKFSLDEFLVPCNNSKNGEKLFLLRTGRVVINNYQKEYLEKIISKSIISPERNNNQKNNQRIKYKTGKIEWGSEEQKNLGYTTKEMKQIFKLLEEYLQNPVNLKVKNKQASLIDNELQAARNVINNYKKIKSKEKTFTKGNFQKENSLHIFKRKSPKAASTIRGEYFCSNSP